MKGKKGISVVLVVLLALALLLPMAACAEKEEPTPTPAPAPAPTPAPAKEEPKYGGVIRIFQSSLPPGWDMHRGIAYAAYYCVPVFNNLVRFDNTKPQISPENIVGDLAERWELSLDGKTYTFFLHKGVKWHDGTPFTADDVVYSIEKLVDPERSRLAGNFPSFEQVLKVDDHTVKILLSQPQPSLLACLASASAAMYAKHKADVEWQSTDFLMGTGPFKFKSYVAGVDCELERNPDYFKKGLPYLDGIKFILIKDKSAQIDAFVTQRVDMTSQSIGIASLEDLKRHEEQAPDAVRQWGNYENSQVLWFNLDYEPLKDVRVRQAMALVTNMEESVIAGFGSTDFRNSERAIMPSAYGLPKAEVYKLLGWDKPMEERKAEAKKLLDEAGYSDGFKLKMVCQTIPPLVAMTEAIADMYRRDLGLDVEIAALPYAEAAKARMVTRDFQTLRDAISSIAGDPDETVRAFETGSPLNVDKYSNPEVDRLIKEQSTETDFAKRRAICQEIERILLRDVVVIPEGNASFPVSWWPYVKGFVIVESPYASHLQMERVWLDK